MRATAGIRGRISVVIATSMALISAAVPASAFQSETPRASAWLENTGYVAEFGLTNSISIASNPDNDTIRVTDGTLEADLQRSLDDSISTSTRPNDAPSGSIAITQDGTVLTLSDGKVYSTDGDGNIDTIATDLDIDESSDLTIDSSGTIYVLDGPSARLISIAPDGTRKRIPLKGLSGIRPTAIAHNSSDGLLYLTAANGQSVVSVDETGNLVDEYEYVDMTFSEPSSIVFAPSADPTDDATEQSLYLADSSDGTITEITFEEPIATTAAVIGATLINTTLLSNLSPPAPDSAGIAYIADRDTLLVSDSEVEEMTIFAGVNLYELTKSGTLTDTGLTQPWSNEPTGVSYNTDNGHLLVSDDGGQGNVYDLDPGPDGRFGTGDDSTFHLDLGDFAGDIDSEGVAYDPATGDILVADGVGKEVWRISPGINGFFDGGPASGGDDTATSFDMEIHGARDSEGIAVNSVDGTILVVDRQNDVVYEVTNAGALIRVIDLAVVDPVSAAGVVLAPASDGSAASHLYVVQRGVDNGANPNENDGIMWELAVDFGPPGNSAPIAVDDADTTAQDSASNIDVLINDIDTNGDPLTVTNLTQGTNGSTVLEPDGTVTYTPDPGYLGVDTFTYTANDGLTDSNVATVTVTVATDPPTAVDDVAGTAEDTVVNIDVLLNDTDPDFDALTVTNLTQPVNGAVVVELDETVTYTPTTDFSGIDTFTYTANDGSINSNTATVTVTVASVADQPVANDDTATADQDTPLTIDVIVNDTDGDGDTLTVTNLTQGTNGSTILEPDGTVTYTPDPGYLGVDTFTYTANDGLFDSNVATVTVTTQPAPGPTVLGSPASGAVIGTTSLTVPHNLLSGNNRRVFISIGFDESGTNPTNVTSVTYGGVPATQVTDGTTTARTAAFTSNQTVAEMWEVRNADLPATGSHDAVVTVDATVDAIFAVVVAVQRAQQDALVDSVALSNADGGRSYAASITTTSSDSFVLDSLSMSNDVGGHTPGPGQIEISEQEFASVAGHVSQYEEAPSAGVVSISGSTGSSQARMAHVILAISSPTGPQPPMAVDDSDNTTKNQAVNIDVLANDTDPGGLPLTVTNLMQPTNGTATLELDGTVTYAPGTDFVGPDSFTYTADNGTVASNVATVTITVSDQPPTGVDDSASTLEDTPVNVDVLANDTDPDSVTLTVTNLTQPTNGTATVELDGTVTYAPNAETSGVDTFTYTANDGVNDSNIAVVTVTVNPVDDPPVAADDNAVTDEDIPVNVDVLANDTDVDSVTLTVTNLTQPTNGTTSIELDGTVTYTPNAGYFGSDPFTYTANDGLTDSNIATVNITVNEVTTPPTGVDDSTSTPEDTPVNIDVLANDTDPDSVTLTVTNLTQPLSGSTVIEADNTITYTPNPETSGVDTFTYTANDGVNNSNVTTVTVTVNPVDDPPVAVNDSASTLEDTPANIDVLANDTDPDSVTLTVTSLTQPLSGSTVVEADNTITYTPNAGFFGVDTFTYRANDGLTDSNIATVNVTINEVTDPPVAVDDSASTLEDTPVNVDVLANDTDPDSVTLTVTNLTQPTNGTATVELDGTVTYAPNAETSGVDTFTYTANDGVNDSNIAVVTVTVNPVDDPPVAADDNAVTDEDIPVNVDVLANDTDVDSVTLTVTNLTQPTNGTTSIELDGTVTYTPNAGYFGSDPFTYTANDGLTDSNIATVNITVNEVTTPPTGVDDSTSTPEDTPVNIDVLANDTDPDSVTLTVTNLTQPLSGSTVIEADNTITYTPNPETSGVDTFTYTANDGVNNSNVTTVTVTVNPVDDPPVAVNDSASTLEDTPANIDVLANDTDPDSVTLTVTSLTQPLSGSTVVEADNTITYTPNAGFFGVDTFTYRANDGLTDSNIATVTVNVAPAVPGPLLLGTSANGSITDSASLALSHTLESGTDRRVFIFVGADGAGTQTTGVTSVTYGGVSAVPVSDGTVAAALTVVKGNTTVSEVWEVREASLPANGVVDAVITVDGTADALFGVVVAVEHAHQDLLVDAVSLNSDSGKDYSSIITTTSADSLVIDSVAMSTGLKGHTPGAGQIELSEQDFVRLAGHVSQYEVVPTAGAVTIDGLTGASQARRAHVIIAISSTTPGGPTALTQSDFPDSII